MLSTWISWRVRLLLHSPPFSPFGGSCLILGAGYFPWVSQRWIFIGAYLAPNIGLRLERPHRVKSSLQVREARLEALRLLSCIDLLACLCSSNVGLAIVTGRFSVKKFVSNVDWTHALIGWYWWSRHLHNSALVQFIFSVPLLSSFVHITADCLGHGAVPGKPRVIG